MLRKQTARVRVNRSYPNAAISNKQTPHPTLSHHYHHLYHEAIHSLNINHSHRHYHSYSISLSMHDDTYLPIQKIMGPAKRKKKKPPRQVQYTENLQMGGMQLNSFFFFLFFPFSLKVRCLGDENRSLHHLLLLLSY